MIKIILLETNGNEKEVNPERYSWKYANEKYDYHLMDKELGCVHRILSIHTENDGRTVVFKVSEV